jgi:EAL domain-containing protein (putative c-di-GMP-specific phosphodiesterase class I)
VKDLLDAILEPGGLRVRVQPIVEVHGEEWRLHGVECLMRGPKGTNLESADILFEYVRRKREEFCAAVPASVLALSRFLNSVSGPATAATGAPGGH